MGYLLIIGAKSDIARALAEKYAGLGYDLYLACRSADSMTGFAGQLKEETGREVYCLELDILDFETHRAFYASLPERPAGVISAVGYLGSQDLAREEFSEAKRVIDTNYTGVVSLLNIVAGDFEKRKSGFIVAISSVAGDRGRKNNYLYGSAKAGLTAYLSGLRNRLYRANVQVLTVKPGFVATQMTQGLDLPERLTGRPQQVADDIVKAQQKGRNVVYTTRIWRWIMLVINLLPEWLFKRTDI